MKKLDLLIIKSYLRPFIGAFAVILFILVLQFLGKYIEELAGKELSAELMGKIFGYTSISVVTLALPLTILFSSLMMMGDMGEKYELAAMKSSGISLFKMMRGMVILTTVITVFSFIFSFFIIPRANLKLFTLLHDVGKMKTTFLLQPEHNYRDIDGYVIYCAAKDKERDVLYDLVIFDHTKGSGNDTKILSDSGRIHKPETANYLYMILYSGTRYERTVEREGAQNKFKMQTVNFDTLKYRVKVSGFDFEKTDESAFGNHYFMRTVPELRSDIDSLQRMRLARAMDMGDYLQKYLPTRIKNKNDTLSFGGRVGDAKAGPEHVFNPEYQRIKDKLMADSTKNPKPGHPDALDQDSLLGLIDVDPGLPAQRWFPEDRQLAIVKKATEAARKLKSYANITQRRVDEVEEKIRKTEFEFHLRWVLPVSCLLYLFIGAPLGAIIRKGGLGPPVLTSVFFFILYYVLTVQGRKFSRDGLIEPWVGAWMPVIGMFPAALLLTWQSATDSGLLSFDRWRSFFRRVLWPFRMLTGVFGKKRTEEPVVDADERARLAIEKMVAEADARKERMEKRRRKAEAESKNKENPE